MARLRHILVAASVLGAMALAPHHTAAAAYPATYPGRDGLIAFQADTGSGYDLAHFAGHAAALPPGLRAALRRALGPRAHTPDPAITWTQQAEITATGGTSDATFGWSVAVSGTTALVGAPASFNSNATGAAYVFARRGTTWTQQAKLTAADGGPADDFGQSVALSGDTALVGAPGKNEAYVFVRSGSAWTQQAELTVGDPLGDVAAVAVNQDTAMLGVPEGYNGPGTAYVFVRSGRTWSQQAQLTIQDLSVIDSGSAVAISGDTVVVGTYVSGTAFIFVRHGSTWSQQAKLTGGDGTFGESVSVSGNTALVGAHGVNNSSGAVYVFVRSGTTWAQQAELTASDGTANDSFGASVALRGSTALIGASFKNSDAGAAYVFGRSGTTWSQQAELTASDAATNDQFGLSVALGGGTALVGAPGKNEAYVFVRNGTMGTPEDVPTD